MDRYIETNLEAIMNAVEEIQQAVEKLLQKNNTKEITNLLNTIKYTASNIDASRDNLYCELESKYLNEYEYDDTEQNIIEDYQLQFLLEHLKKTASYEDNRYYRNKYNLNDL